MLLEGRHAVVYRAGGALGGAVSRAFAREGATVFARTSSPRGRERGRCCGNGRASS
jgi:3-oxoacyl-[acyl-carrier protein] reductase